jgi:hypothetical protein
MSTIKRDLSERCRVKDMRHVEILWAAAEVRARLALSRPSPVWRPPQRRRSSSLLRRSGGHTGSTRRKLGHFLIGVADHSTAWQVWQPVMARNRPIALKRQVAPPAPQLAIGTLADTVCGGVRRCAATRHRHEQYLASSRVAVKGCPHCGHLNECLR